MHFSIQQQAAIDFPFKGCGSAFIEAVAGAGKTTTLIELLVNTKGSVDFAAYNKKIADEIKGKLRDRSDPEHKKFDPRFRDILKRVHVGTFHSFGLAAWRKAHPDVEIDENKKYDKSIEAMKALNMAEPGSAPESLHDVVMKLVSLGKQRAIGINGSIDDDHLWYDIIDHFDLSQDIDNEEQGALVVKLAKRCLRYHIALAPKLIDFDDMIYMPLMQGIRVWQNDWVLIDEAQDTNPARRALARKMLKPNGRAVFVGDRHQAIYGFTGADGDAVDQIIRDFRCTTIPLTVTYRCPKNVVNAARTVVKHIEAHETAPAGCVRTMSDADLLKTAKDELMPTDAVLCRKTAPLVKLAFSLIRKGVACHVEGKEIGVGLLKLVDKYKAKDLDALREKLEVYRDRESQKLIAKGKETQAEALIDRVETIFALAENCETIEDLRTSINVLFSDEDGNARKTLTLSTVHKAKGREWPRVFVLGSRQYMPSPWARKEWQQEQENNLIYVAYTRAQEELIHVDVSE